MKKDNTIFIMIMTILIMLFIYSLFYVNVITYGDSMKPTLKNHQIVRCKKRPKEIEVRDIIAFKVMGQNIIHRVVEKHIIEDIGEYYYTKGDNNEYKDVMPITKDNILCKVIEKKGER